MLIFKNWIVCLNFKLQERHNDTLALSMIWFGFAVEDFSKPETKTFKLMESITYE